MRVEARERILLVAERLIAERGLGVPLREIAVEAGQRNNSAVHYHFGSRDGLVRAIVERRMEVLEKRQIELLARYERDHDSEEVRGLVDVLVRPMFHVPYEQGATHYARFLEQVRVHPVIARAELDVDHWATVRMITARLDKALSGQLGLAAATRRRRLASMSTVLFALLADRERGSEEVRDSGGETAAASSIDEVIDMIVGLLTATGDRLPDVTNNA